MDRIIELTLDHIAHGGEAIGRHAGKVIFAPYAIPGERVRVEIVEEKERWARARLLAVLEPSPDRVEPPCPHFGPGKCGGCQWQHIAYERQAELKQQIVADQLHRLGHIAAPPVADIIALADPYAPQDTLRLLDYGYRNEITFSVQSDGRTTLRGADGAEPVPVDGCLLVDEQIDELHGALDTTWSPLTRITLRASRNTGEALVLLETEGEEQPELEIDLPASFVLRSAGGIQPLIGEPFLIEEVRGIPYRISPASHFPPNTAGAAALVDVVLAYADPQPERIMLDAYCGVGLFALPLADAGAEVIGLESSPAACEDFAFNAGNRLRLTLHEGNVEQILPALINAGQRVDVAVLNPPRTGAGYETLAALAQLGAQRLVYVAGDPAALARDAVHLSALGYRLIEAQPIDLLPQTSFVETVALWEKTP